MKRFIITYIILLAFPAYSQNVSDKYPFEIKLQNQKNISKSTSGNNTKNTGNNYDLKYYRFVWEINPAIKFIKGEAMAFFLVTSTSVNQISFDLSDNLTIDSIKHNSTILDYSLTSNDELFVNFDTALSSGELDSLSIFYHGIPPGEDNNASFVQSYHDTIPVIWTLSEPFGAKDWWPCKQNLSDKIDSIDIFIITPKRYKAASNGILVSEIEQGDYKTYYWKHRYPIEPYLIGIAVTDYQVYSDYFVKGTDSLEILNYVYNEHLEGAKAGTAQLIKAINLYDSLFIPYPFEEEKYGHAEFGWGGGMEHQTISFVGSFSFELLSHELAHQWFGDKITCGSWADIWLNEGFATYANALCYEYLFTSDDWLRCKELMIQTITKEPNGSVFVTDSTSQSSIFSGRLSYNKGAYLLHMIRWIIGDSAFYNATRNYLNDSSLAYGFAHTIDLKTHFETASNKNLGEFFADWFYGEGYPSYRIYWEKLKNNQIKLTLEQTQSNPSVDFFEMPVPIYFSGDSIDTTLVLNHTFSNQEFYIDLGFDVSSISFDPDLWILSDHNAVIYEGVTNKGLNFTISPNPSNDQIKILFYSNKYKMESIAIYDMDGTLLMEPSNNNMPINIRSLNKGMYLVKAKINNTLVTNKFVKY